MAYFKCKVCGRKVEAIDIDHAFCKNDGNEDPRYFEHWGPARIYLTDGSGKVSFHKNCVVGRDDFRMFPEYKYVSQSQFELEKTDECWKITRSTATVNSTFVNENNIDGKTVELQDGDELFIGNISNSVGLKLQFSTEIQSSNPSENKEIPQTDYHGFRKHFVDLVFLIDTTNSMKPCLEVLKSNLKTKLEFLESPRVIQNRVIIIKTKV